MDIEELKAEDVFLYMNEKEIEELEQDVELPDVIGQPRALRALKMGTEIRGRGYNIFVTGQPGTGRNTAIKKVLDQSGSRSDKLRDIFYVFNFDDPDYPEALSLPQGEGRIFKQRIHQLVENMKELIGKKLDGEAYKQERDRMISMVEQEENRTLTEFEQQLRREGFQLVQVQDEESEATDIAPIHNGEVIDFDKMRELVSHGEIEEEKWHQLRERYYQLMDEMKHLFQELRANRGMLEKELESLQVATVTPAVEEEVEDLKRRYQDDSILTYLDSLKNDIIGHLFLFLREQPEDGEGNPALVRYGVNIVVDNGNNENVPVIFENHPSSTNLFGTICLLYTSPSPRDRTRSRMPSSA